MRPERPAKKSLTVPHCKDSGSSNLCVCARVRAWGGSCTRARARTQGLVYELRAGGPYCTERKAVGKLGLHREAGGGSGSKEMRKCCRSDSGPRAERSAPQLAPRKQRNWRQHARAGAITCAPLTPYVLATWSCWHRRRRSPLSGLPPPPGVVFFFVLFLLLFLLLV